MGVEDINAPPNAVLVTPKAWYKSRLFNSGLVFFGCGLVDLVVKWLAQENLLGANADAVSMIAGAVIMILRTFTSQPIGK